MSDPTCCRLFTRYISSTTTRTMAATRKLWLNWSVCFINLWEKSQYLLSRTDWLSSPPFSSWLTITMRTYTWDPSWWQHFWKIFYSISDLLSVRTDQPDWDGLQCQRHWSLPSRPLPTRSGSEETFLQVRLIRPDWTLETKLSILSLNVQV